MSDSKCLVGKCHRARFRKKGMIPSKIADSQNLNARLWRLPPAFKGHPRWSLTHQGTSKGLTCQSHISDPAKFVWFFKNPLTIRLLKKRCASLFWWKFGAFVIVGHWSQVSRIIGLQLRRFLKKYFKWEFCLWNEVWKNTKDYHISLSQSIQTSLPKQDYEVPVER